ncbi:MAG TPA: DUF1192 domain-containing protein [Kiloniellaceae bacterium]|nr:DUF1192 domain-containing protein [Kiloniellaceae bacterium]
MEPEDLEPRKALQKPVDLDSLGVEELEAYLQDLEAEMGLVKEKIAAKKSYLTNADAFFKR